MAITNECVKGKETTYSFDGTGFSASNKENYAAKRQRQNSNKSKKSKTTNCELPDDSFPTSNSTTKKGFSYCVIGAGVRHKLISGIAISPDHSIGETTMFPEAFHQTLSSQPNLEQNYGKN